MSMRCMLAGGVSLRAHTLRAIAVSGCLAMALQASEWSSKQDRADAALEARDYSAAAQMYSESIPLASNDAERAASRAAYGIALSRAGRNREAKPVLEQALASGVDRQAVSASLASADRSLGDYQSAEHVLRAASGDTSGSSAGRAELMVNLADLFREEARWSEADSMLNQSAALPDLPRRSRVSILVERAELRREMHQWQESISDWNAVGTIAKQEHSGSLEEVYTGGLGETWLAAGETVRAEPLLRRSLELLRNDPASSSTQIAMALALMARVYTMENKLALARQSLDEAISRDEVCLGQSHPQVAMLLELRAAILSRRGDAEAARDDLDRARSIMTAHFGAESAAVAGVDAALGDVEDHAHEPALAAAAYEQALILLHKTGTDGMNYGEQLSKRYVAALKAAHRSDAAKAGLTFAAAE